MSADAVAVLPLAPSQEGLVVDVAMDRETESYRNQTVLALTGACDVERLEEAWAEVVARHAALRTAFGRARDGSTVQRVARSVVVEVPVVDLRSRTDPEDVAHEWCADQRRAIGRIDEAPLVRLGVVLLPEGRWWLVVTHHHLVLDGWSTALVLDELLRTATGGRPTGAATPRWEAVVRALRAADVAGATDRWVAELDGSAEPSLLFPRSTVAARHGIHRRDLGPELMAALSEGARRAGVTAAVVVQCAWGLALAGLLGRDDVVFGATVSGRSVEVPGAENVVGPLALTVPRRLAWGPRTTVGELLGSAGRRYARLDAVALVPLPVLLAAAGPGSRFDTAVVYENYPTRPGGGPHGPAVTAVWSTNRSSLPLTLVLTPGSSLVIDVEHPPAELGADDVELVVERFVTALRYLLADPEAPVRGLDLRTDTERRVAADQLAGVSGTAAVTGCDLVRDAARAFGQRPAVEDDERSASYDELLAAADRVASGLRAHGVHRGDVLAVVHRPCVATVAVVLGAWSAGVTVVPLDPALPTARLGSVVEATSPSLVASTADDLDDAHALAGPGRRSVGFDDLLDHRPGTTADPPGPDDVAYVIFTSGSTGEPKGVVVTHRGLADLACAQRRAFEIDEGSRVLQLAAPSFDGMIAELVSTLSSGACLVLRRDRFARMPGDLLAATVNEARVTHVTLPPSAVPLMPRDGLTTLRCLVVAGEPADGAQLAAVPEDVRVVNAYGPTEATVCATASGPLRRSPGAAPIGTVVDGVDAYVLDGQLRPVPPGAPGELYLAGDHLALGYLARPGETASRFVADPFAGPGRRMYRTGDLVTWGGAHGLVHLGRTDDQVQVRGQRVEPTEVDRTVELMVGVRQCATVGGSDGDEGLVSWVVAEEGASPRADEVREHVARLLPAVMVPARVELVDELPRTTSGKIDLPQLRSRSARRDDRGPRRRGPTAEDRVLCEIFSDVLGTQIGPDDDFFAHGGHSLTAVRLAARVDEVLDLSVDVRDVFEAPTPARLAARARPTRARAPEPPTLPERVPLAPAQERLWFLQQLEGGTSYNLPFVARLSERGPLDCMVAAVSDVVARHESARTLVREHPDGTTSLDVLGPELAPLPRALRVAPAQVEECARELAEEPFDLTAEPPFRAAVLHDEAGAHALVLVLHHIGFDAESVAVLAGDLERAWEARHRGRAPDWLPLRWQWPHVVAHRAERRGSSDESLRWWREELAGAPSSTPLPGRSSTEIGPPGPVRTIPVRIDPTTGAGVARVARACRSTPFMVLHAAVAATLTRFGAGSDVVVGTSVTTRDVAGWSEVAGLFLDTVLLRLRTDGDPRFGDLVLRARRADARAFAHHDAPYEQVVRLLGEEPAGPSRGVDVTIDLAPGPLAADRASLDVVPVGTARARFPLSFAFWTDASGALHGELHHDADGIDPVVADSLATALGQLLHDAVADPRTPLGALRLQAPADRRAMLDAGEGAALPGRALPVRDRFRRAAQEHADRVAVVERGCETTYASLRAAVVSTAGALRALGVAPGRAVAFVMPVSGDALVTMLAVLEIGASYVPVDPQWPAARAATVLAAVAPEVVVVTDGAAAPQGWSGLTLTLSQLTRRTDLVDEHDPEARYDARHAAYVLFTSGSTGEPKAVTVEHHALEAYVRWACEAYPEAAGTTLLHTRPTFDLSITTQLVPLLVGGTVRVVDLGKDDWHGAPAPELTKVTPSHLPLMESLPPAASPSGRLVVGGEQLTGAALRRFRERFPHAYVTNDYGPTETTVNCVEHVVAPGEALADGVVPIGRPLPGNAVAVLDTRLEPVPTGVDGELYVWGEGLARGYGDARLTASRFVANPFGAPGARMYRTGDVVRWEPDGTLRMTGRSDRQVKIRGHRLELDEVEAVVGRLDGVRASVATVAGVGAHRRLAVVAATDEGTTAASVRDHLRRHLPAGACPDTVVRVDALPLTPHGKIDHAAVSALVARRGDTEESDGASDSPASARERLVADVFAAVLAVDEIGPDDDFFAMGGHSLLALVLARRLTEALGVAVPLAGLLAAPSPRALVAALEEDLSTSERASAAHDLGSWSPPAPAAPRTGRPRRVLLTGATGHLGGHVLDLLVAHGIGVVCPVRADTDEAAGERLAAAAVRRGAAAVPSCVRAVAADLALPGLGLAPRALAELLDDVDAVVHSAADTSSAKSYADLRAANVVATRTLLEIAAERGVAFHHVSTSSVVPSGRDGEPDGGPVPEDRLPPLDAVDPNPYVLTKRVAEQHVRDAGRLGLSTRVYRPSRITAHSQNGLLPDGDAFSRALEAVVRSKAVPTQGVQQADELFCDLVAVDAVAEVIVREVLRGEAGHATLHLVAGNPVPVAAVLEAVRRAGVSLTPLPDDEWEAALDEVARTDPSLSPDLVLASGWPVTPRPVRLDRSTLEARHPDASLVRGDVDVDLLQRVVTRLVPDLPGWPPHPLTRTGTEEN